MGGYSSLALDSEDNPHISYHDSNQLALKYAYWTGSSWEITAADDEDGVGRYTSIALDSNDNPHISYFNRSQDNLKYAFWTGSTWSITTVDAYASVGKYSSLELDSEDNPHISYLDSYASFLKYAYWTGSAWSFAYADDTDYYVGMNCSLALDSGDNPHISYFEYDPDDLNLRYARYDPTGIFNDPPYTPTGFALYQSYPNPSTGSATISFALPETADVTLEIFDIKGRKVATLVDAKLPAGDYERSVSGLASGLYLYRLEAGDYATTKKMVVK